MQTSHCSKPELSEIFPAYLGGNVSLAEELEIETHFPACLECQEEMRFYVMLREAGRVLFLET